MMQMFATVRMIISVLLVLGSMTVGAVTLGEARVKSFLNQPLDAEIDLVGLEPGQHADLRLRVANQEYFDRLGIVYTPTLAELTFDVVQADNRWLVRVRSSNPVIEPFIDFPLLMRWPGGQMIRQYTLLVDPIRPLRKAQATQTSRATPARPAPRQSAARQNQPGSADSYGPVQRGETLWPIAQRLKPAGITTRQMAMALLRANPQAFIDGNINKLRAGSVLALPDRDFIEQLDADEARRQFTAATRTRQAAVATSPRTETIAPPPQPEPTPPAKADTAAAVDDKADAKLRIVGEPGENARPGSEADLQEKLLVTMEEIESNRLTTDAIETRLARLESELERMQALVELKDAQIAALQSEARAREAIAAAKQLAAAAQPAPSTAPAATATPSPVAAAPTAIEPPAVVVEASVPSARKPANGSSWPDGYLWLIWVALGLIGLASLLLMLRRRNDDPVVAEAGTTPAVMPPAAEPTVATPPPAAEVPPRRAEIREAEEDLRAVADARLPEDDFDLDSIELPELDLSQLQASEASPEAATEDITESVLAEMLEETELANDTGPARKRGPDFDDDDIASWVRELGDHDGSQGISDNDDEIPSILHELDDQLSGKSSEFTPSTEIDLEPVDGPVATTPDDTEDDAFRMSLDLARAYLEIGDQEGARDMLKQALYGARDPDHRQQIEELLQQIG
jgi:FimV-like protein